MKKISQLSLLIFAVMWNQMQNQTTPPIHLRILNWLETSYEKLDTRLLLMAFRSCGKSTLVGIFCAWVLYRNPNMRMMVLAADDALARKMVRNVKRIIERHPLTAGLKPQEIDQWGSDRFTVKRGQELRDPSMLARGITSNITGARADMIIYDDVEVPNTSNTVEEREELRERLTESRFILTPQGFQIYVGTPHTYDTIYATNMDTQKVDQGDAFLNDFQSCIVPILNDEGESAWPNRFPIADINAMRKQVGPNKFASQMMLQPVNIAEGRLDVTKLHFYQGDLDYKEVTQKPILFLNGKQLVSCSAWWDPAFGSAHGDASVFALVFTDEDGQYYLHHIEYIRVKASDKDDEATQQCKKICDLISRFFVPYITIEINGIGKFLPSILRRELRAAGVNCAVVEHTSRTNKSHRILESFDAVMAAQALNINESVKATPFLTEMREWNPSAKNGRDDGVDAVAGALSQEPIIMAMGMVKGRRQNWQPPAKIFKAKT
jgi:hypothetical protein